MLAWDGVDAVTSKAVHEIVWLYEFELVHGVNQTAFGEFNCFLEVTNG